jgi:hypothetical protein
MDMQQAKDEVVALIEKYAPNSPHDPSVDVEVVIYTWQGEPTDMVGLRVAEVDLGYHYPDGTQGWSSWMSCDVDSALVCFHAERAMLVRLYPEMLTPVTHESMKPTPERVRNEIADHDWRLLHAMFGHEVADQFNHDFKGT